ncbi:MAG TPA: aminotransferase class I/II-fold pyridoxal phosphate-dependent enzyme [Candidatus Limnocylindrales bacterium]
MAELPLMFDDAAQRPFADIEVDCHTTFFASLGQHSAPIGTGRIVSTYSSTVALDIVARVTRNRTGDVALLHPTFDNIADLFHARGLRLHPVTEQDLDCDSWHIPAQVGALVLVSPNNPTGWVLDCSRLRQVAERCAAAGAMFILDASFRGQDTRAQYDTYEVLDGVGCDWIVVEDTGKLWPVSELKSGFLAWSGHLRLDLVRAVSEVLLSVSPVILSLITRLAMDGAAGGYAAMRTALRTNRSILSDALEPAQLHLTDPSAQISVARVTLPSDGPDAENLYHDLVRRGVHTLPCQPFHWARPHEGARFLRLSIARPPATVERAVRELVASASAWNLRATSQPGTMLSGSWPSPADELTLPPFQKATMSE